MAKAADFDGKANETEVVTSESVKGKRKTSILGTKARLWLITINNPQNHGISLEQAEILERFKEDIASGAVTYVSSVMERSLTTDENGKHTPHGHIAAYYPSQELGGHLHKLFPMQRIVFACDEVAELLDKTGADKARKELLAQIEARLALIARQGRAFGIHLILATQRPDANILPGQIKNNMNIRICGRADTTLSTIIIGDGRAAEQIPHDAQGRFLMEDGTVFQAYYFNDDTISAW